MNMLINIARFQAIEKLFTFHNNKGQEVKFKYELFFSV